MKGLDVVGNLHHLEVAGRELQNGGAAVKRKYCLLGRKDWIDKRRGFKTRDA